MNPKLRARALAAGLSIDSVRKRIASGWIEADLLVPPQPPANRRKSRHAAKKSHPWKVWMPGRFSRSDKQARGQ
jgi:hypothetical protein